MLTAVVLSLNIGAAIAAWWILASAAGRSGLAADAARRFRLAAAVILGAWPATALLLAPPASSLATSDPFRLNPLIPAFFAGSVVGGLAAFALSGTLRRVLASASVPALIGVQLFRVIGAVFLVLLAAGRLPAHFAKPAGWGDLAVSLSAPLVALALARGMAGARGIAIAWSLLGLLDLMVAVGMGTGLLAPLLAPELGARVPPVAAMGTFPMLVIPAFMVPLAVLLHLAVLWRLVRGPLSAG
jgi:hypothetical protein